MWAALKCPSMDVEAALVEIVATHCVRSTDEAVAFVGSLKKAGRYQADVY